MRFRPLYLTVATLSALACHHSASDTAPVTWSVDRVSRPSKDDSVTSIEVRASIADGWHIYAADQSAGGPTPTKITLDAGSSFTRSGVVSSDPHPVVRFDSSFHMNVAMHERAVRFSLPVNVSRNVKRDSVGVAVRYQACNQTLCYPPQTAHLFASLRGMD